MWIARFEKIAYLAVITPQCPGVVIPVHRHGKGVGYEEAIEGTVDTVGGRNRFIHRTMIGHHWGIASSMGDDFCIQGEEGGTGIKPAYPLYYPTDGV